MTAHPDQIAAPLACSECGYDLRAHPADGKCPECGASVSESRRLAAIPRRPAWRDSDPRWRRRILAGVWILLLLPAMDLLDISGWASSVPGVAILDSGHSVQSLADTLFFGDVRQPLCFCVGIVLLFSKESGRRRNRLDWTRRWGVIGRYVVFLLCAAEVLFITALVTLAVTAVFLSMPPQHQPSVTGLLLKASTSYLWYGPQAGEASLIVLTAFSSITILFACVPLFDALRSSGRNWLSAMLLAPLAFFALMQLKQAIEYWLGFSGTTADDVLIHKLYFCPLFLVQNMAGLPGFFVFSSSLRSVFLTEIIKWCSVLAIALWLTIAQIAAWRKSRKPQRDNVGRGGDRSGGDRSGGDVGIGLTPFASKAELR
jgi:hypothetical protein